MCLDIPSYFRAEYLFISLTLLLFFSFLFFLRYAQKRSRGARQMLVFLLLTAVHLILIVLSVYLSLVFMPSKNGFVETVNAAIKNACILDPSRKNCPSSVEGVYALDQDFQTFLKGKDVKYEYRTEDNTYNLKIFDIKNRFVYIFDPKLRESGSFAYKDNGYEYADFEVRRFKMCGGEYKISNQVE